MDQHKKNLKVAKIIDKLNDHDLVDIDDIVSILINYSDGTSEKLIIQLTGKYITDIDSDVEQISLNSPIGKAIFGKKYNSKVSCTINNEIVTIEIGGSLHNN